MRAKRTLTVITLFIDSPGRIRGFNPQPDPPGSDQPPPARLTKLEG